MFCRGKNRRAQRGGGTELGITIANEPRGLLTHQPRRLLPLLDRAIIFTPSLVAPPPELEAELTELGRVSDRRAPAARVSRPLYVRQEASP
jgi:hypothetical protein